MTYPLRPFYYTQRFCITAIFTVIATAIVLSTSGIGPFQSQSQLHAAKSDVGIAGKKDEIAKDEKATEKKTTESKTETTNSATATEIKAAAIAPEKVAEKTDEKAVAKDPQQSEDKNKVRNISFDTVKFEMEKGDNFERKMLTPAIEKLHGRKVRVRGYILPPGDTEITDGFFLTRDNGECCFGPGAIVYDRIYVVLKPDVVVKYVTKSVTVTGLFEIKYLKDPIDDSYMAVYQLSDVEVN